MMNLKNKLDSEDSIDLASMEVPITREQQVSNIYRIFVDREIGLGQTYYNLISLLGTASEEDVFVFHLSSPGGSLEAMMQVYLAMINTRAHTVAQIDSYAASAATLFIMAAKQVLISPHAYIMIHGASWGYGGHMQEVKRVVEFQHDRLIKIINDIYKGFLTEQEIKHMIEDQCDYYFDAEEISRRMQQREDSENQEIQTILEDSEKESLPVKKPTKPRKPRNIKND